MARIERDAFTQALRSGDDDGSLTDDYDSEEFVGGELEKSDRYRAKLRHEIDDYLEQKRLRDALDDPLYRL